MAQYCQRFVFYKPVELYITTSDQEAILLEYPVDTTVVEVKVAGKVVAWMQVRGFSKRHLRVRGRFRWLWRLYYNLYDLY